MINLFNISEKHKAFTWTPPSTASRLSSKVFDNFDFWSYVHSPNTEVDGLLFKKSYVHNHLIGLPKNHEDYKIILTCRNPYTRALAGTNNVTTEYFVRSLEDLFQSRYHNNFINLLKLRKPDYFIRVENLLEDYKKIPFIYESDFYKSGELEKLINNNPYKTPAYFNRPIIDKKAADLIYYSNVYYFDLIGYDKNSWRQ